MARRSGARSLRYLLDHNMPFTVDGHAAVAGAVVSQPGRSLATWIADDQVITVSGTLPLSELIAVSRTFHAVSPQEWEGMKFQATRSQANIGRYERSSTHEVASGTDSASAAWDISVGTAISGGRPTDQLDVEQQRLHHLPDHCRADTHRRERRPDLCAGRSATLRCGSASLRINAAGLDVTVPFADVDSDIDRTFAAYAFSEAEPFTATVVGSDALVLATWPSP